MADGKVVIDTELDPKGAEKGSSKLGSALKKGLGTATKTAVAGISAVGATAVATAGTLVKSAKDTADYGDKVDKMSQKIGMSAKAYQEWDFVLQQNGTDISTLQVGMKTLSTQASKNSKEFKKLGITQKELKSLSPEQLFERTVAQLQKMPESTERTALSAKLLGKSAVELKPLLNSTAESTKELRKQANEYGMVMSNKAVKASATFNDSLNKMKHSISGAKNTLLADLLPSMTLVTDGLAKMFKGDMSGVDDIVKGIDQISKSIEKKMPMIIKSGGKIVGALGKAIISNLPTLVKSLAHLVPTVLKTLGKLLPKIWAQATSMIKSGISKVLGDDVGNLFGEFAENVANNVNPIMESFVRIIKAVATAIAPVVTVLLNVANAVLPALSSALEWVADNIDTIIPLVVELGVAMVALWIANNWTAIIGGVTTAIQAMFTLLQTHPIIAIITAVTLLTTAIVAYSSSVDGKLSPSMQKFSGSIDSLIAKQSALSNQLRSMSDEYNRINQQSASRIESINSETELSERYWNELQKITDENGNIKKGYEDRAKYITGELSNALGTEITITKGQIQDYKELQKNIKRTIVQKQLERAIDAKAEEYALAKKQEVELVTKVAEAEKQYNTAKKVWDSAQKMYNEKRAKGIELTEKEQEVYNKALGSNAKAINNMTNANKQLEQSQTIITNYDKALGSVGKSTKAMKDAYKNLSTDFKQYGKVSEDALRSQADTAVSNYKQIKDAVDSGSKSITKKQEKEARAQAEKALKEYGKCGENAVKGYVDGIEENKGELSNAVVKMVKEALNAGKKEADMHSPSKKTAEQGKWLAQGYVKGFQKENPFGQIKTSIAYGVKSMQNASLFDSKNTMKSSIELGMSNIGDEMVYAMQKAGLKVSIGEREFGRVVRSVV